MRCRKKLDDVKTGGPSLPRDEHGSDVCTARAASGIKVARTRIRLLCGTWEPVIPMQRENLKRKHREGERTEAEYRGGATRSSAEGPVMGLEERQANWLGYSGCKSRVMKLKPSAYLREPCVAIREDGHEASVAVRVARDIEHRKSYSLGRRGFLQGRRQHVRHRYGETANRPTVSKTPWTHVRILLGPGTSSTRPAVVRGRKGKALAP